MVTDKTEYATDRRSQLRYGLHSPKVSGVPYIEKQTNIFRRSLEDKVLCLNESIDVAAACLIHSATEAQRLSYMNRKRFVDLKSKGDVFPEIAASLDDEYLKLLTFRDKKLSILGLVNYKKKREPWTEAGDDLVQPQAAKGNAFDDWLDGTDIESDDAGATSTLWADRPNQEETTL